MALPNAVVGSTHTGLTITWKHPDTTTHVLTGATITGRMEDENGTARDIDGTLALSDAANGVFTWAFGPTDVGTAGKFKVQFIATFASDSKPDKTYTTTMVVERAL